MLTRIAVACLLVTCLPGSLMGDKSRPQAATGYVFLDANGNGVRDVGERGLPEVPVSNGREVVVTDADGMYELLIDDDSIMFVVKPRNYMPPVNEDNLPQFYYVHKPSGSPKDLDYPGVAPTGPLPDSVDFPLIAHPEKDEFEVVVFGDPQPNDIGDVAHFANDVVSELIGTDMAFGVALGDLGVLDLWEPYNQVVGTIGIPFYSVQGNHDVNLEGVDMTNKAALSNESWKRVFGPATYSWDWGPVHFITLRDFEGFDERQLKFVENDLKFVPKDALVVLFMHVPLEDVNREDLFALFEGRPCTLSFAGHDHTLHHRFYGAEDGWPSEQRHHELVAGAACGIHWLGVKDEYGIPAAMTHCGSPNGYPIITFSGSQYKMRFKAPRRPDSDQMSIFAPAAISAADAEFTEVVVNVFCGSEYSTVEMRLDDTGEWRKMERSPRQDPYLQRIVHPGHPLEVTDHIWALNLPANPSLGGHVIHVRTRDMFGQEYSASRVIRITGEPRQERPIAWKLDGVEHAGIVFNAQRANTGRANELVFNGRDTFVSLGNQQVFDDDFTITAWVKPNGTAKAEQVIVAKERGDSSTGQLRLYLARGNRLGFMISGEEETGVGPLETPEKEPMDLADVPPSRWSHVAVVRDGRRYRLLINSEPMVEMTADSDIRHRSDADLRIGARTAATSFKAESVFAGSIDEVCIYRRALSEMELKLVDPQDRILWDLYGVGYARLD